MRKRLLALGLASMMVLSLAGCKKNTQETETTVANGETTVAIADIKQTGTVADYSSYITLGQYTGLEIPEDAAVVTDEDIQNYKESVVYYFNEYYAESDQITNRATVDGDVINMDFKGLRDGVAFDGGTATGVSYTVGSGQFIEDLDKQLAGLDCGKQYDLTCKFPDNYSNDPSLAGVEVVFQVTVNYIQGEKHTLEWSDELVNKYTSGQYTTAAAYEEYFTANLISKAEEDQKNQFGNDLLTKICENSTFADVLPQEKIEKSAAEYYDYYVNYFTTYASYFGMDYASYLNQYYGMDDAALREECTNMATTEVKYIILTCQIAKDLGYTLSDEEYAKKASELAAEYEYSSAEEFIAQYGEDYIRETFIYDYVSEYLLENNTMVINQ